MHKKIKKALEDLELQKKQIILKDKHVTLIESLGFDPQVYSDSIMVDVFGVDDYQAWKSDTLRSLGKHGIRQKYTNGSDKASESFMFLWMTEDITFLVYFKDGGHCSLVKTGEKISDVFELRCE